MVEIKRDQNTSDASNEDPTDAFSRRFITREHMASSQAFDRDRTAAT